MNDDLRRTLMEEQRHALRMVVKMGREEKWWEFGTRAGWTLLVAALAWTHSWANMITMGAWGFFIVFMTPRAIERARKGGWSEAWGQAFSLAMKRGMPMEVCLEMLVASAAGMPSDRAKMDEARMRLAELEEELGE